MAMKLTILVTEKLHILYAYSPMYETKEMEDRKRTMFCLASFSVPASLINYAFYGK